MKDISIRAWDAFVLHINNVLNFSNEEIGFVDNFTLIENPKDGIDILRERFQGRHPSWIHVLVRDWAWHIFCLRKESPIFFESYPHRVNLRSIIQRFLQAAAPELRNKVANIVDPLDREFMRVTQPSTVPLPEYGGPSEGKYYPWQWRVPRRMRDEGKTLIEKIAKYPVPPDEGYEWPPGTGDPFEPWVGSSDLLPPP
jgi:hypothetical protein